MSLDAKLAVGMPVLLLEGNWLHDAHVAGQGGGFVSIQIGTAVRLVRRHCLYALPQERTRLRADLQHAINQLQGALVVLAQTEDPTFEHEEEHDAR